MGAIDDLVFNPAAKRLGAAGAGSVDVFQETAPDHYRSLGQVPTGPGARNGRVEPELERYFATVPEHERTNAKVLEYDVQ
jgi:hypothetical protein